MTPSSDDAGSNKQDAVEQPIAPATRTAAWQLATHMKGPEDEKRTFGRTRSQTRTNAGGTEY